MIRIAGLLIIAIALFTACSDNEQPATKTTTTDTSAAAITNNWKLGVAFWTFHTFNLPDALAKIDSSGVGYVEGVTFFKAGPEFKDSMIFALSQPGLEKAKETIQKSGLKMESIYIVGDTTISSWKKQFELAKLFGVKYVTAEPPVTMWDEVDSLAGVYSMKVAIHEHWKGVSAYWNPDTVLLAIQGHPNFGACADLGHWPKSGIDPLEAVKKLKGHIIGIHLKDIAAANDPKLQDVPVGTGIVNFPAIFQELKEQRFNGYIYIERDKEDLPSNLPSVIQTVKYYKEQVSKLK